MIDKNTNPLVVYLEDKFHQSGRKFLQQAFKKIPSAVPEQVALVIAADVAEHDLIFPLEKGYHVIAFDGKMIYYDLTIPAYQQYKDKIKIVTKWDFEALPPLDIVMASFILPFYKPEDFQANWEALNQKIKMGGYFIGTFFDLQCDVFKGEQRQNMTFHSKEAVLELFKDKDYDVLEIKEIKKTSFKPEGLDYYYEVFARKV